MVTFSINIKPLTKPIKEKIKLTTNSLDCTFISFTGKTGDFWISVVPSLNVTGYGKSEKEAIKDLKYNIKIFNEDLFKLDHIQRMKELKKLGWKRHKYFKKQLSSTFIDEKGILQNFDHPKQVKKSILEAV